MWCIDAPCKLAGSCIMNGLSVKNSGAKVVGNVDGKKAADGCADIILAPG